jgi:hypothetical protein
MADKVGRAQMERIIKLLHIIITVPLGVIVNKGSIAPEVGWDLLRNSRDFSTQSTLPQPWWPDCNLLYLVQRDIVRPSGVEPFSQRALLAIALGGGATKSRQMLHVLLRRQCDLVLALPDTSNPVPQSYNLCFDRVRRG